MSDLEALMRARIEEQRRENEAAEARRTREVGAHLARLHELFGDAFGLDYGELEAEDETARDVLEGPVVPYSPPPNPPPAPTITDEKWTLSSVVFRIFCTVLRCVKNLWNVALASKSQEPQEEDEKRLLPEDLPGLETKPTMTREEVEDAIFDEFLAARMTAGTFREEVRKFLETPRVQNILDTDEQNDWEGRVMKIVLNFGNTKNRFLTSSLHPHIELE